ncbi:MAG TPA: hypothetical protein VMP01_23150 [Pirellulaceae bacterium]|nr:hypothetical protein [Pirellulaceae bacterium]
MNTGKPEIPVQDSAAAAMTPGDSKSACTPIPHNREKRMQKLREYGDKVLAMANPLVALLGFVELDLHAQLCYIRDDLDEVRSSVRDPIQRLRILLPLWEQYYKIAKQLEPMIKLRDGIQKGAGKVFRPPAKLIPSADNTDTGSEERALPTDMRRPK